jgi:hypothetical protein
VVERVIRPQLVSDPQQGLHLIDDVDQIIGPVADQFGRIEIHGVRVDVQPKRKPRSDRLPQLL